MHLLLGVVLALLGASAADANATATFGLENLLSAASRSQNHADVVDVLIVLGQENPLLLLHRPIVIRSCKCTALDPLAFLDQLALLSI